MDSLTFQETARFLNSAKAAADYLAESTTFHPANIETALRYVTAGDFAGALRYSERIGAALILKTARLTYNDAIVAKAKRYLQETGAVWSLVS